MGVDPKQDHFDQLDYQVSQKKILKVLGSAQILVGIGTGGAVAAGSLLVSAISHSESLAGLAQTSGVLGAATMALPLARLTQRGGRRLSLATGYSVGVFGASLAIIGGTHRILFLMLCGTFLVGAASAAGYQARFAATDLATNESRSRNLSFVVWGSTIGTVAGPNLMAPAGALAMKFQLPKLVGPYLIAMITFLAATIVIRLFLRPDPYLTANAKKPGEKVEARKSTRVALSHIREFPMALFAMAAVAFGHLVMVSVMVMTPIHMAHVDVSLKVIGLVISVHVLGMYAFSPLIGFLSDRFGRIPVIQMGVVLLLAATVVAGTSTGMESVKLGMGLFLLGLGWSCTLIAGSTLLSESVDISMRPASQGASDLVMNLMGAGGGVLAGIIIGTLSYGWLCLFASAPVIALGIWSFRLRIKLLNK